MCSSFGVYNVLKWVEVKIDKIFEALDLDHGVLVILQKRNPPKTHQIKKSILEENKFNNGTLNLKNGPQLFNKDNFYCILTFCWCQFKGPKFA